MDYHGQGADDDRYAAELRASLKQATFVNRPQPHDAYRWLASHEVVEWCNRSHVGLCLSASEGAMRASMEYLLCGLPVVSTPSIGGRDIFFHPSFARIVEPEPQQIAAAVATLIAEQIPPERIRGYVVPRVRAMRHRFQWLVQTILDEAGAGRIFAPDWKAFLAGNWLRYNTIAALLAEIEALRETGH
ncbi:MAG: hypothetical protein K0S54_1039 [Alphaproteobacteria bacterium]|nr:hypothetical protein [Alphaproteobacteria bacterium]